MFSTATNTQIENNVYIWIQNDGEFHYHLKLSPLRVSNILKTKLCFHWDYLKCHIIIYLMVKTFRIKIFKNFNIFLNKLFCFSFDRNNRKEENLEIYLVKWGWFIYMALKRSKKRLCIPKTQFNKGWKSLTLNPKKSCFPFHTKFAFQHSERAYCRLPKNRNACIGKFKKHQNSMTTLKSLFLMTTVISA